MTNEELQRQINELRVIVSNLSRSSDIPFDIEQAFRTRLRISSYSSILADSKLANSENQTVNESGSSSYSVLGPPDRFIKTTINGTAVYIPGYN